MKALVFEDLQCDQLSPITTGRLAAAITCGSYRLIDLISHYRWDCVGLTRPYMEPVQQRDFPQLSSLGSISSEDHGLYPDVLLNARLVPQSSALEKLDAYLQTHPGSGVIWDRESIAAWIRPPFTWKQIQQTGYNQLSGLLSQAKTQPVVSMHLPTLQMPHEVIAQHMKCMHSNLEHRIANGSYNEVKTGVFVQGTVDIGEYVLCDSSAGPIIMEDGVKIGPYTLLRGPIYLGRKCKVLEHAAIKDAVAAGHTTKIGGEVEASIIEPYSNKQHHGFLGHSYLGSWINLGAGTCNSDLKNTYGTVNVDYHFGKVATGMQFLGCVMGDYSKTAINTGIFTGKVIGVCSMMYGFITSNVPSFVNYARLFGQMATLPPEVMIATQQRMFSRRQVEQTEIDRQLVHAMYSLTQAERDRLIDA